MVYGPIISGGYSALMLGVIFSDTVKGPVKVTLKSFNSELIKSILHPFGELAFSRWFNVE